MDTRVLKNPQLESQAVALDLLRQVFLNGPTMGLVEALRSVQPHALDLHPQAAAAMAELVSMVRSNGHRLPQWLEDAQVEYTRLFIGPQEPRVLLYASCHLSPTRSVVSEETLAVRNAYAKSGLVVERLDSLPDDHLGVELEFIFALTRAAADAASVAEADRLLAERARFVQAHLAPWLDQVANGIAQETGDAFFQQLQRLLRGCMNG